MKTLQVEVSVRNSSGELVAKKTAMSPAMARAFVTEWERNHADSDHHCECCDKEEPLAKS